MTLNWKSNESGSLTLDLSLAADDVIEGALAGHQGEQAGRRHEQEEHGAHDGQFCNWEIQKSYSFKSSKIETDARSKTDNAVHNAVSLDIGGSETKVA